MDSPSTLIRDISPPRISKHRKDGALRRGTTEASLQGSPAVEDGPSLAAIEAGQAKINDHLKYFKEHLARAARPIRKELPRLSIDAFSDLYQKNENPHGHHFVVHQHNHPIAGVHYDLRLQFSGSSSVSFAIPYGLPGNPNSRRQGRMAIETRVHNFWNHLIESASHETGSLLIWDTGTYSVLPRHTHPPKPQQETSLETTDSEPDSIFNARRKNGPSDTQKLISAFQSRYIRLRLHGTKLPDNYTITLRLPSQNDNFNRAPSTPRKRRRKSQRETAQFTDSDPDSETDNVDSSAAALASGDDAEDEAEAAEIRANNAYTGSENTIGSVHQRKWFVTLDKRNSGFGKGKNGDWIRNGEGGFDTFYVMGADSERSIVTGRTAAEVEKDEGVEGFVRRKGWRPVLE